MNNDEELTFEEQCVENEMKENFINNYAHLVADNVATYYKYYENNSHIPLRSIKAMSKDDWNLNDEDIKNLNHLIEQALQTKHNLKLVSDYEDDELILEKLK